MESSHNFDFTTEGSTSRGSKRIKNVSRAPEMT